LEAAVAGLGVGLSPWIYVANDIAAGRLAAPFGFTPTPARFHFVLPGAPPKRGLKAFREWLIEEAAKAPAPPILAEAAA
jgi:LysR family glycine cleavage system transcriptional activator